MADTTGAGAALEARVFHEAVHCESKSEDTAGPHLGRDDDPTSVARGLW